MKSLEGLRERLATLRSDEAEARRAAAVSAGLTALLGAEVLLYHRAAAFIGLVAAAGTAAYEGLKAGSDSRTASALEAVIAQNELGQTTESNTQEPAPDAPPAH